jgi:hypothetical protein
MALLIGAPGRAHSLGGVSDEPVGQGWDKVEPALWRRRHTHSPTALHSRRFILTNRRVRTRTHGCVTGKASDRIPMSIGYRGHSHTSIGFG